MYLKDIRARNNSIFIFINKIAVQYRDVHY